MEQLQILITSYWPYLSIPFIIGLLKAGVDALNIQDVEKVFFTNSLRVKLMLSKTLIFSLLTFSLFTAMLYTDLFKDRNLTEALVTTLVVFVCSFLVTLLIYFYISIIYFIFGIKSKYKIIEEDKEWYVIRRVNKDTVLVANEKNAKFIDWQDIKNKVITRENQISNQYMALQPIVNYAAIYYLILFILSLALVLYVNAVELSERNNILIWLSIFILYSLLLLSFIAWNNRKIIKANTALD